MQPALTDSSHRDRGIDVRVRRASANRLAGTRGTLRDRLMASAAAVCLHRGAGAHGRRTGSSTVAPSGSISLGDERATIGGILGGDGVVIARTPTRGARQPQPRRRDGGLPVARAHRPVPDRRGQLGRPQRLHPQRPLPHGRRRRRRIAPCAHPHGLPSRRLHRLALPGRSTGGGRPHHAVLPLGRARRPGHRPQRAVTPCRRCGRRGALHRCAAERGPGSITAITRPPPSPADSRRRRRPRRHIAGLPEERPRPAAPRGGRDGAEHRHRQRLPESAHHREDRRRHPRSARLGRAHYGGALGCRSRSSPSPWWARRASPSSPSATRPCRSPPSRASAAA